MIRLAGTCLQPAIHLWYSIFSLNCGFNRISDAIKRNQHSIYNQSFFETLFEENYRLLFSLGYRMCGDSALTKDVIQSLFMELWEKRYSLNAVMHWKAYLRKSYYRSMLAEMKSRQLLPADLSEEVLMLSTPSYEQLLIESETTAARKKEVENALNDLPDKEKEMLQLRFKSGLSYEEIAEYTGKSKQTVYNQIYTAIKKLKGSLLSLLVLSI